MKLLQSSLIHPTLFLAPDGGGGGGGNPSPTLMTGVGDNGSGSNPASADGPKGFVGEDGVFVDGWGTRLPEEFGEYRTGIQAKFKSLPDFVKSYQSLEQKLGSKATMLALPGPDAKPEDIAAYRAALGVPETPDGYQVKPEKLPDGVEWNDAEMKPFIELAHKYNVPPEGLKEFIQLDIGRATSRMGAAASLMEQELAAGTKVLTDAWGKDYKANMHKVGQVMTVLGLDENSPGLRDPNVVKALYDVGLKLSDDTFIPAGGRVQQGGPNEAMEIINNPQHPQHKLYWEGHKGTVEKVNAMMAAK